MKYVPILCCIALLTGCDSTEQHLSADDKPEVPTSVYAMLESIPGMDTGRVLKIDANNIVTCNGSIEIPPNDLYSVHSRVEGFVSDIRYIEGDAVRAGEQLMVISNPDFIAIQRSLLELQVELDLAEKRFSRQSVLAEKDATSSKLYDESSADLQLKKASYQGLANQLEAMGFDVHSLTEKMLYQQYLSIVSPVSGWVHDVHVNAGQMVKPDNELMKIAGIDHIHLELRIVEKDVQAVALGDSVSFSVTGIDTPFAAEIIKINAVVDETGVVKAHCHLKDDPPPSELKPGMFAQGQIFGKARTAYGLHEEAVVKEGLGYYGYMLSREGMLTKSPLENAAESAGYILFTPTREQIDALWITSGAYYVR